VATPNDQSRRRDHAVSSLPAFQFWILFDAINRHFGRATEHRKNSPVFQKIDGVVAPFASGNFAAIEVENAIEFAAAEGHLI
jgi:hypothetical protein